jgi:DNA-binding MarR family transcriptional regulator
LRYFARANRFSRTPAALAEHLGSTRGTVSQTLISLEAKGLIERQANARDGRSFVFALTKTGRNFLLASSDRELAAVIDHTGMAADLADNLEAGLRTAIVMRGWRAFGACHTSPFPSRSARGHHAASLRASE